MTTAGSLKAAANVHYVGMNAGEKNELRTRAKFEGALYDC